MDPYLNDDVPPLFPDSVQYSTAQAEKIYFNIPSNKTTTTTDFNTSQEETMYFNIPSNTTTATTAQRKSKICRKKCMYVLCFIVVFATAGIAITSLIISLSSNKTYKEENETQTKLIEEENETQKKSNKEFWMYAAKNCYQLLKLGFLTSGVYNIAVGKKRVEVYCDMETDGGGWTVIQRRVSNDTDFYRGWFYYQNGFGNLSGNFWLGLDNIYAITSSGSYKLRVDLQDFSNNEAYALYNSFSLGSESSNYRLHVSGYSGNAGDSLNYQNNQPFTTKDRDNDANRRSNCAVKYGHGAWWYNDCHQSNLNGKYCSSGVKDGLCIRWMDWKILSLKRTKMEIKPN